MEPGGRGRVRQCAHHRDVAGRQWPAAQTHLDIHVTDGRFVGYDAGLRLLTLAGKPLGPLMGSYHGAPMFRHIGTPQESLVHGQEQWEAVQGSVHDGQHGNHGGPEYGFYFWESLTPAEIESDYAYLEGCGWTMAQDSQRS